MDKQRLQKKKQKAGIANDYATYVEFIGYPADNLNKDIIYRVYPGVNMTNDYNIVRNTKYAVNATIKGTSVTDQRVSVRTLSNCYVLTPGQIIYIPVNRANQTAELGMQIPDVTSTTLQPYIYWQSIPNLVWVQMDYPSGCLMVRASTNASTIYNIIGGNAVVGVTYGTGTAPAALWSWHIWVTSYDPNSTNLTQNNTVWMDRNLGAMEACNGTTTFDRCGGLYYQGGRKDPFPGFDANGNENVNYYNGNNNKTGLYAVLNADATGTGAPNYNLPLAVQNPTAYFQAGDYTTNTTWCGPYPFIFKKVLWDSAKTVYDPCPVGWKVPTKDSWTSADWETTTQEPKSQKNYRVWSNNSVQSYYPVMPKRILDGSKYTTIYTTDYAGCYWTSYNDYGALRVLQLWWNFAATAIGNTSYANPITNANPVRCVKE